MTLIQKLPLGLALAACMMMSSCSQEDVQPPYPETENSLTNANSRVNALAYGGVLAQPASIPNTEGRKGVEVFPTGWAKVINVNPDGLPAWAAGTSSLTHLWGDPLLPWAVPLSPPAINANSIVTFQNQKNILIEGGTRSTVKSKIKNLIPGKKYAVTLSFATTVRSYHGESTQYAQNVHVNISSGLTGVGEEVDLVGKEATWVTKTIVFEAKDIEATIQMYASTSQGYYDSHEKFLQYAHVYVGNNAVQKL